MGCRLTFMRPGLLPKPSIWVGIRIRPTSVVSGVKSPDWPWALLDTYLEVKCTKALDGPRSQLAQGAFKPGLPTPFG